MRRLTFDLDVLRSVAAPNSAFGSGECLPTLVVAARLANPAAMTCKDTRTRVGLFKNCRVPSASP